MLGRIKRRSDRIPKKADDFMYFEKKKQKRQREKNDELEQKAKRKPGPHMTKSVATSEKTEATPKRVMTKQNISRVIKEKSDKKLEDLAAPVIDVETDFKDKTDTPEEKVILQKTETYRILEGQSLIDTVNAHLEANNHLGRSVVWKENNNDKDWGNTVELRGIAKLINEVETDCMVMNAYISILQKEHDERNSKLDKPPFTVYCLSTYVASYLKKSKEETKIDRIISPIRQRPLPTFLIFPIYHGEGSGVGHWTVIVCWTPVLAWTHFDSMRPRHECSKTFSFAKSLMNFVNKHVTMGDGPAVVPPTIINDRSCAQQEAGSLDCGIFVLKVIDDMFTGGRVGKFETSFCALYRTEMVKKFLHIEKKQLRVLGQLPKFDLLTQESLKDKEDGGIDVTNSIKLDPSHPSFNLFSQDILS